MNIHSSQFWRLHSPNMLKHWQVRQIQCLMRVFFLIHRWPSSHCVLSWQKGERALWGFFSKGTNPIHGATSHDLITSQRPHLPMSFHSTGGQDVSTYQFGGETEHNTSSAILSSFNSLIRTLLLPTLKLYRYLEYQLKCIIGPGNFRSFLAFLRASGWCQW